MKTRIINTNIWRDGSYVHLSEPERLFAIYLLSNSDVGLTRCYQLPKRTIEFDLGKTSEEIELLKGGLQDSGTFAFYNDWIFINNDYSYCDYQGGKTFDAKQREVKKIPEELVEYIGHVLPNHCPIIASINNESKTIEGNQESLVNKSEDRSIDEILGE